jgi:hypothetical protein
MYGIGRSTQAAPCKNFVSGFREEDQYLVRNLELLLPSGAYSHIMPRTLSLAAFAAMALAQATFLAQPVVAQNSRQPAITPLDFDPAHPEKVEGWWTNGQELMHLEPNGAYQMWLSQDRFATPAEVGAWRRSNYVLFDLESYRAKPGTRIRVELVKRDGVTCIARTGMAPLKRVSGPPRIFADDLLGAWVADKEQLVIMENGRYEYRRLGVTSGISQHNGIWRTEGQSIFLGPDTAAVAAIRLDAEKASDGSWLLRGVGGVMRPDRPEGPPPASPAQAADKPAVPANPASPAVPAPSATPATPASPATPSTPATTPSPAPGSTTPSTAPVAPAPKPPQPTTGPKSPRPGSVPPALTPLDMPSAPRLA